MSDAPEFIPRTESTAAAVHARELLYGKVALVAIWLHAANMCALRGVRGSNDAAEFALVSSSYLCLSVALQFGLFAWSVGRDDPRWERFVWRAWPAVFALAITFSVYGIALGMSQR